MTRKKPYRSSCFTKKTAAIFGKKGGKEVSKNRAYMKKIGRRGGLARQRARRAAER